MMENTSRRRSYPFSSSFQAAPKDKELHSHTLSRDDFKFSCYRDLQSKQATNSTPIRASLLHRTSFVANLNDCCTSNGVSEKRRQQEDKLPIKEFQKGSLERFSEITVLSNRVYPTARLYSDSVVNNGRHTSMADYPRALERESWPNMAHHNHVNHFRTSYNLSEPCTFSSQTGDWNRSGLITEEYRSNSRAKIAAEEIIKMTKTVNKNADMSSESSLIARQALTTNEIAVKNLAFRNHLSHLQKAYMLLIHGKSKANFEFIWQDIERVITGQEGLEDVDLSDLIDIDLLRSRLVKREFELQHHSGFALKQFIKSKESLWLHTENERKGVSTCSASNSQLYDISRKNNSSTKNMLVHTEPNVASNLGFPATPFCNTAVSQRLNSTAAFAAPAKQLPIALEIPSHTKKTSSVSQYPKYNESSATVSKQEGLIPHSVEQHRVACPEALTGFEEAQDIVIRPRLRTAANSGLSFGQETSQDYSSLDDHTANARRMDACTSNVSEGSSASESEPSSIGTSTKESPRKGTKNRPRTQPNHCLHLWEFLLNLLNSEEYCPNYITWTHKDIGEFKLVRTEFIANLWGQSKKRKKMTYEKMARALRYYYKHKVLEKVPHKRLHFRFGSSIMPTVKQSIVNSNQFY